MPETAPNSSPPRLRTYREFYDAAVRSAGGAASPERGPFRTPWPNGGRLNLRDTRFRLGGVLDFSSIGQPVPPPAGDDVGPHFFQVVADSALRSNATGSLVADGIVRGLNLLEDDQAPTFLVRDAGSKRLTARPFTVDAWMAEHSDVLDEPVLAAYARGEFDGLNTESHLLSRISLLGERLDARDRLGRAGLIKGLAGGLIGAGFLDPVNYATAGVVTGISGAREAGTLARTAARLGDAAVNAGIQSAIAQATSQGTMTADEVAANTVLAVGFDFVTLSVGALFRRGTKVVLDDAGRPRVQPEAVPALADPPPIQETGRGIESPASPPQSSTAGSGKALPPDDALDLPASLQANVAARTVTEPASPDGTQTATDKNLAAFDAMQRLRASARADMERARELRAARLEGGGRVSQTALHDLGEARAASVAAGADLAAAIPDAERPTSGAAGGKASPLPADGYAGLRAISRDKVGGATRNFLRWVSFGNAGRLATTDNGPAAALYRFMFKRPNLGAAVDGLAPGRVLEHAVDQLRVEREQLVTAFEKELQGIVLKRAGVDVSGKGVKRAAFETAVESLPIAAWPTRARDRFAQAVGFFNVFDDGARGLLPMPWHVRQELAASAAELGMSAGDLQAAALRVVHALGDPKAEADAVTKGLQSSLALTRAERRNSVPVITLRETADLDAIVEVVRIVRGLPENATIREVLSDLLGDRQKASTWEAIENDPALAARELRAWINRNAFGNVDKATARALMEISRAPIGAHEARPVVRVDYQATVTRTTRALVQLEALEHLRRMERMLADPASPVYDERFPIVPETADLKAFYEPGGVHFSQQLGDDVRTEIRARLDAFTDRANTYDAGDAKRTRIGRKDAETAVNLFKRLIALEDAKPRGPLDDLTRTLTNLTRAKLLGLNGVTQLGDVAKAAAEVAFLPHSGGFFRSMRLGAMRLKAAARGEGPQALKLLPEAFEGAVARTAQMYNVAPDPLREINQEGLGSLAVEGSRSLSNVVSLAALTQPVTGAAKSAAAGAAVGHVNALAEAVLAALDSGAEATAAAIRPVLLKAGATARDADRLLSRVSVDALADWARAVRAGDVEYFNGTPVPKVTRRISTSRALHDLPATKVGLERILRDTLEQFIDRGDAEDVAFERSQVEFSTRFNGPLPVEVKEALSAKEGGAAFGLMRYVVANAGLEKGAGAADFIDEFGLDEWLRRLKMLTPRGRLEEVLRMAKDHPDPEIQFAGWLYATLDSQGAKSLDLVPVPIGRLHDGESVGVGEAVFKVSRIAGDDGAASIRLAGEDGDFTFYGDTTIPLNRADAERFGLDPTARKAELAAMVDEDEAAALAAKRAEYGPGEGEWDAALADASVALGETGIAVGEFDRLGRWIDLHSRAAKTDALVLPWVDDAGRGAIVWQKRVDADGAFTGWDAFEIDGETGEILGGEAAVRGYPTLRDALIGETGQHGERLQTGPGESRPRGVRRVLTALGGPAYDDARLRTYLEHAAANRRTLQTYIAAKSAWYSNLETTLRAAGFNAADISKGTTLIRDLFGDRLTVMRGLEFRIGDEGMKARGSFDITPDAATGLLKASITLAKDANLQTFLHEVVHYAHALADDATWKSIEGAYGVKRGAGGWTRQAAEALVQDVLKVTAGGARPEGWTPEFLGSAHRVFTRVADLMQAGIAWVAKRAGVVAPQVQEFANALFSGRFFVEESIRTGEVEARQRPISHAAIQERLQRTRGMLEEIAAHDDVLRRATYERAVEDVMAFVSDYVNEVVLTPAEADRPLFTDSALGAALWTFWQYPALVSGRLLLQVPSQSLAHNATVLASMFSAGAIALMLKAWIRNGEDPIEWVDRQAANPSGFIATLLTGSGALGLGERPISLLTDAVEGDGWTKGRGGLVAALLPVAGAVNDYGQAAADLIRAATSGRGLSESAARNLYRAAVLTELLPFQVLGAVGREFGDGNAEQDQVMAAAVRRALAERN